MVAKPYDWATGAVLDDHSRRKHKILREYFRQYISTRCQLPQQSKFRLAVVDGFSGAGRYACGSPGSPVIFIEELRATLTAMNIRRAAGGLAKLEIQCLFIFNDANEDALRALESNCAPLLAAIKDEVPDLHLETRYLRNEFEASYPGIKALIGQGRFRNVLFNLDQCGHSQISHGTVRDIMQLTASAEIFYTFAIQALLTFLHRRDPVALAARVKHLGIPPDDLTSFEQLMSNDVTPVSHPAGTGIRSASNAPDGRPSSSSSCAHALA